ncbi:helix-turn-helix domain-containing protein [Streptomyces sp. NBC_01803]|uniref:helix-turn-helix domain-containing protein n=1 Tax=Streptomyces sp. NBC_01803 TaxID=2975946 RepID=UPI002DDA40B3|nr:helix-turn-helix domain-containing protein [Streptomyces sp. NBC_01803]WSA42746.1 helix-turn-helix domain-containing protein [Streptomyces sp. NBC_01803]
MSSTERDLRVTVAALMFATGETQTDLGAAIGLAQAQVSRRQAGTTPWTLADVDRLAAHYGIPVPDLLAGADHAVRRLPAHRRAATLGGTQTVIGTTSTDEEGGGRE